MFVLMYGCTILILTKRMEMELDGIYTVFYSLFIYRWNGNFLLCINIIYYLVEYFLLLSSKIVKNRVEQA